jgi:hypothetical protein
MDEKGNPVLRMPSFGGIIQSALQEQPQGELEWFMQCLAALNAGQIDDVKRALEQAIAHKQGRGKITRPIP